MQLVYMFGMAAGGLTIRSRSFTIIFGPTLALATDTQSYIKNLISGFQNYFLFQVLAEQPAPVT